MISLFKARRLRKSAEVVVGGLFELGRYRPATLPPLVWLDPYVLGFLSMLVTCVATRTAGQLSAHTLALVQADTLEALTGLEAGYAGEQICLLSAGRDPDFLQGCRNALTFVERLEGRAMDLTVDGHGLETRIAAAAPGLMDLRLEEPRPEGDPAAAQALWQACFEQRLDRLLDFPTA